jgi:hypothetical protein
MVLRRIQDETGLHKLNSRWEGSFVVSKVTGPGSYRLVFPDGQEVPNFWNIEHLPRFYPWRIHWTLIVALINGLISKQWPSLQSFQVPSNHLRLFFNTVLNLSLSARVKGTSYTESHRKTISSTNLSLLRRVKGTGCSSSYGISRLSGCSSLLI